MIIWPFARRVRWLGTAIAVGLIVALVVATTANAETGTVTVTATNAAKITISVADASANFGTNLDPSGVASNSGDTVAPLQGSTGNQGSYYVWKAAGSGLGVTVKSNKVWNGLIYASENGGAGSSASLTIASGALRWGTSDPATYADSASLTAFSTVTTTTWVSNVAKGSTSYANYYALRVDWNDDPGTFSSNVTYSVSQ